MLDSQRVWLKASGCVQFRVALTLLASREASVALEEKLRLLEVEFCSIFPAIMGEKPSSDSPVL